MSPSNTILESIPFNTELHSKCMGILQDCGNDATVFCPEDSCNRGAFCLDCSQKLHQLHWFQQHTPYRKDATIAASKCHFYPLSQCHAVPEVSCVACGGLRTCQSCFTNYHRRNAEQHSKAQLLLKDIFTIAITSVGTETKALPLITQSQSPAQPADRIHSVDEQRAPVHIVEEEEENPKTTVVTDAFIGNASRCVLGCQQHADCRQRDYHPSDRHYHIEHDETNPMNLDGEMYAVSVDLQGLEKEYLNLSPHPSPQLEHGELHSTTNGRTAPVHTIQSSTTVQRVPFQTTMVSSVDTATLKKLQAQRNSRNTSDQNLPRKRPGHHQLVKH